MKIPEKITPKIILKGKLVSGVGEGAHYIKKYTQVLKEKLEFLPYPGTLNLVLEKLPQLPLNKKILILPPAPELFPVDAYLCIINNTYKGAILLPHQTVHKNTLEVIAPEKLALQIGDEVLCELV